MTLCAVIPRMIRMRLLLFPVLLLGLPASTAAGIVSERATGPFFTKLDDETWVIGNEVWNMTQQVTYGVKLYYHDHDCVGDAVGHYVSFGMSGDCFHSMFRREPFVYCSEAASAVLTTY